MAVSPSLSPLSRSRAQALDLDLLRKYAVAGPRYTSYPPANRFVTDLPSLNVEASLAEDNQQGGPLSLYFHLPFCESRCWYCGCHTIITRNQDAASAYLHDLEREIDLVTRQVSPSRRITQLHLGGGTPTFLSPDQLLRLGDLVHSRFRFEKDAEISVEIDPRRLTPHHVRSLVEIGATRASLGIQDTNRAVQLAIHRYQPHELNVRAFEWLRAAGFTSINVDLIYGLPRQTRETFAQTLHDVSGLSPDRFSIFSYAHVPWIKPAQRIFEEREQLPGPEEKLAMFAEAHRHLTGAGYLDIGLDHFARPNDELAVAQREGTLQRNFQGYSTRAGASLLGFGVSAISQTQDSYRQNLKGLPDYRNALAAGRLPIDRGYRLTEEDKARRAAIMAIMCERRLDTARLYSATGYDVARLCASELAGLDDLVADGIIERIPGGFVVTPSGAPLLRVVAMRFDGALQPAAGRHAAVV